MLISLFPRKSIITVILLFLFIGCADDSGILSDEFALSEIEPSVGISRNHSSRLLYEYGIIRSTILYCYW